MSRVGRFFRHLCTGPWTVKKHFSEGDLAAIEQAIKEAEQSHGGEIRFCVEAGLDPQELMAAVSPRQRAQEVFAALRVWDTEENNGVLLYLLLADKDFEIVADRAVSKLVREEEWAAVCREIEDAFRSGKFTEGVKLGIRRISDLLKAHFPTRKSPTSELPNQPAVLP